ncbi:MAG: hypothetical protein NZM31_01400 [Gemmatales bacterium]|nr:hypothetical protein [Gemmatales bacterium]MDW8385652.1 hypothetical protein [Gemmatales bacterium]
MTELAPGITEQDLIDHVEEALPPHKASVIEKAIRESEELMAILNALILARSGEEHSVGAIWERHRLSCPTRDQLSNYLVRAMSDEALTYIAFHLEDVDCPYCQAELEELKNAKQQGKKARGERARKTYHEGVALLSSQRRKPRKS